VSEDGPKARSGKLTRRDFLKTAAAAASAAAVSVRPWSRAMAQGSGAKASPQKAKLAIARSDALVSKDYVIDQEIATRMVDAAVAASVGAPNAAEAYKLLFKPDDAVAIKVNSAGGIRLSTRPHVVRAIVDGLKRAGLKESSLIIFDRSDGELAAAGFHISDSGDGPRCYGTDHEGIGCGETEYEEGKVKARISKIITDRCSALINVPILKDHGGSGVTLAMKNHYGSIQIRSKTRLIVMDAIYCCYDGGPIYTPGRQWYDNSIWASTDPVATDRIGAEVIDGKRKEQGLRSLADTGRPAKHIDTAGAMGLGVADKERISVQDLNIVGAG
jgi:uncharacterized protein (DUF362 family)